MECRESYISVDVDIECCRSRRVAGYKRGEESGYFKCDDNNDNKSIATWNGNRLVFSFHSFFHLFSFYDWYIAAHFIPRPP